MYSYEIITSDGSALCPYQAHAIIGLLRGSGINDFELRHNGLVFLSEQYFDGELSSALEPVGCSMKRYKL